MYRFFAILFFAYTLCFPVLGQDGGEAQISRATAFVSGLTHKVFDLIEDPSITSEERDRIMARLINENVGIDFLARLMLASEYRASATADQVAAYDSLSRQFVVDLFIDKIGILGEHRLDVVSTKLTRRGDVIVKTRLTKKDGGLVDVDWRVKETASGPRVINLSADGVSIVIVKRDEFSSIARADGFDALLQVMRDSLAANNTGGL